MNISINLELASKDVIKAVQRNDVIIVIDVLRCCSTIVTAFANGATEVIPVKTLAEAYNLHRRHPEYLLAGERKGLKLYRFHLGNSPLEFTPEKVRDKRIILTTTNGTKTFVLAKESKWVFAGALLNVGAVVKTVFNVAKKEDTGISIVLSGNNGAFNLEDFLCAGAIYHFLPNSIAESSDTAKAALLSFLKVQGQLSSVIQNTDHAQRLISLGLEEDVKYCAQKCISEIVPFLKGEAIIPFNYTL